MGRNSRNQRAARWGAVSIVSMLLVGAGIWWVFQTPEDSPAVEVSTTQVATPSRRTTRPSPKPDLASTKTPPQTPPRGRTKKEPPSRSLAVALRSVDEREVKRVVDALSDDALEGRLTGSEGIARARTLLTREWKTSHVEHFDDTYLFPWISSKLGECANLIAVHHGSDPALNHEVVVIGAHYDHIGMAETPSRGDSIYNGADDNASGSVAVLFAAKLFAEHAIPTKRTIIFALFSGEEQGFYGSEAYCETPPLPLNDHVAMVNLDMVGRNPHKALRIYGTGTSPAFPKIVKNSIQLIRNETHTETISGLKVLPIRPLGPLFKRSDQYEFWSRKIPVMVLHSGVHADYHKLSDHSFKLSTPRLVRVTRLAMTLAALLADSPKPFPFRKVPR